MASLRAPLSHAHTTALLQVILFWYASRLKPGFAEACMVKGAAPPEVAEALYRRVAVSAENTGARG